MDGAELLIADPFGLAHARIQLDRADQMLVYPRVYELEGLFTDGGTPGGDRGRSMLHRTAGYDLHSIREHQVGESLRRVHWRSTARRRQLMVKELAGHAPRRGVRRARRRGGRAHRRSRPTRPSTCRCARPASLLRRMSDAGQRSSLIIHAAQRSRYRLGFGSGDWAAVLGELAAVEANAPRPLADYLAESSRGPDPVDAARVFVVTASMSSVLAERVLELELGPVRAGGRLGRRRLVRRERPHARHGRRGGRPAADAIGRRRRPDPMPATTSARRSRLPCCAWWWPVPRLAPAPRRAVLLAAAFLLFAAGTGRASSSRTSASASCALLALLGVAPTIVAMLGGGRIGALIALAVATVAAIGLIMHTWPWQTQHGFYPARVVELVGSGLRDWFGTHTPIDAGRFAGADHDLQLAFFAAAVALAWLIVRREAGPGRGSAWPSPCSRCRAPVLPLHATASAPASSCCWRCSRSSRPRSARGRPLAGDAQVVGLSVAVVLAGLIVGTAPGVTKSAFLSWQSWNPLANQGPLVSVDYMWNQSYAPLHWPKKRTTVLEVTSTKQMYWKAATLDTFLIDHWQFSQQGQLVGSSDGRHADRVPPTACRLESRRPSPRQRQGEGGRPGRRPPDRRRPAGALDGRRAASSRCSTQTAP